MYIYICIYIYIIYIYIVYILRSIPRILAVQRSLQTLSRHESIRKFSIFFEFAKRIPCPHRSPFWIRIGTSTETGSTLLGSNKNGKPIWFNNNPNQHPKHPTRTHLIILVPMFSSEKTGSTHRFNPLKVPHVSRHLRHARPQNCSWSRCWRPWVPYVDAHALKLPGQRGGARHIVMLGLRHQTWGKSQQKLMPKPVFTATVHSSSSLFWLWHLSDDCNVETCWNNMHMTQMRWMGLGVGQ